MRIGFDRVTQRRWIKVWAVILLVSCAAAIAVVLVVLWAMAGFRGLGMGGSALIALLLGTFGTAAMSVVLMGLLFYSNASRHDAEVLDLSVDPDERPGRRSRH